MRKLSLTLPLIVLISACTSIPLKESARDVRVIYSATPPGDCRLIADTVGSAGHWYNYLFITNTKLSMDALNDIKNKTHKLGGNAVRVVSNREFITSVTLMGQAYFCEARP